VRVLGGAVSFAYKADRLVVVGSTALPDIAAAIAMPSRTLAPQFVAKQAAAWLHADLKVDAVPARAGLLAAPNERVIIPIVRPRTTAGVAIQYRVAEQLAIADVAGPGRWNVWLDAQDGAPIVRASTISYASGRVLFDVPDQWPGGTRSAKPAALATHLVDGVPTTATLDGTVTWASAVDATILPQLTGARVAITNVSGSLVAGSLALQDAGTVTWSQAASEQLDAQLSSYVFANTVKEFVKTRLDPNLAWLDAVVSVSVNEQDVCNAYSTGDDVHFFLANAQCENTGRLADVVYHEIGHSVHANSIIAGVGAFDGSLSEGLADTLGVNITGDHGLGRGFFFSDAPLRDVDPVGTEKHWPEDADGEVHDEGEIIGGTLWDLRVALQTKLGQEAGFAQFLEIYYGIMQRAADIPSSYVEALVADDDDGDLTNGTPNQCTINTEFGRHGLADPTATLGISAPTREGFMIGLTVGGGAIDCPGPTVDKVSVDWRLRGGAGGSIDLANVASAWAGTIPTQGDGAVVEYKVVVKLSDGTSVSYPNNAADPYYQFYVGEVTKLWCTDFEAGADEWTHNSAPTNRDDWQVGAPIGLGGDPTAAFSGTNVFGNDLTTDGTYRRNTEVFAETPEIDLQGNVANVHLQYRRWLGVEDGFFDGATIQANGTPVWTSFASAADPMSAGVNHLDKEWRFQDVDVSAQAAAAGATGKMKLRFALAADAGLEFAGWNLDDVCLVVAHAPPVASCGDGAIGGDETCDDGNGADGDGCSASCQLEDATTADGGCCSSSSDPTGALALSALAMGLVIRRRRRS
ncbi:MAG: DUF4215 domain-containing protein, partial [Proteobacteria bacterium]|nr:DUF4215 domain-containing protein [Pseudomonadota bacterium]